MTSREFKKKLRTVSRDGVHNSIEPGVSAAGDSAVTLHGMYTTLSCFDRAEQLC